jgi:hypothetical protein
MRIFKGKRTAIRAAILTLIIAVVLPAAALANPPQGRGKGQGKNKISQQEKKNAKFKNGHDARDGRWDGRGPRDDRDDDYDYDNDGYRDRNRRRDRDNNGTYDRTEIRRQALSAGYNEGYRAGRDDRASGRSSDYDDHSAYRDATIGYRSSYGDVDYYRSNFRDGFRQGYQDGYRNRSSRGGRWGDILGDILGRP